MRTSTSRPVPKVCTCASGKPAVARRSRTSSTCTGLSKPSSMLMPPVKSSAKLKPLSGIAATATTISSAATASEAKRRRMKSKLLS